MFRILSGLALYLETLKNLEFEIFYLEKPGVLNKSLEIPEIFKNFNMFSSKISI